MFEQVSDITGPQREFLQAVLIAREVEQVIDQLHQALHFFIDRVQQVRFARLRRKLCAFAEQAERHVHAGHWRAQFMGSA